MVLKLFSIAKSASRGIYNEQKPRNFLGAAARSPALRTTSLVPYTLPFGASHQSSLHATSLTPYTVL